MANNPPCPEDDGTPHAADLILDWSIAERDNAEFWYDAWRDVGDMRRHHLAEHPHRPDVR